MKRFALLGAEGACAATHQIEDKSALSDRFGSMDERFADAFLFDQRSISLRNSWGMSQAIQVIGQMTEVPDIRRRNKAREVQVHQAGLLESRGHLLQCFRVRINAVPLARLHVTLIDNQNVKAVVNKRWSDKPEDTLSRCSYRRALE